MATHTTSTNTPCGCYRDCVADRGPVTETDVGAGFDGAMGGLVRSVAGWVTDLWAGFGGISRDVLRADRELAFGSAGVGVPHLLVGTIAGWVGMRDFGRSAVVGIVLTLAALARFGVTSPGQLSVTAGIDHSAVGVTCYGLGLQMFLVGGAVSCRVSE